MEREVPGDGRRMDVSESAFEQALLFDRDPEALSSHFGMLRRPMSDIPGLVVCHICGRSGPGVDELIALPDELESEALRVGCRCDEEGRWTCLRCQGAS